LHFNYYGREVPEAPEEKSEINVELNVIEPTPEMHEFFDQLIKGKHEKEEIAEESLEDTEETPKKIFENQPENYNQPWLVKQQEAIYNSNKK